LLQTFDRPHLICSRDASHGSERRASTGSMGCPSRPSSARRCGQRRADHSSPGTAHSGSHHAA
jgi:hypothetical protein